MKCQQGHEMAVRERFRFDHEPGDSPRDTESLRRFDAMGIELGAEVTVWYCEPCDFARATFDYDARREST
jgi:FeoA domain